MILVFGNGQRGARLPTGQENVKAVYRNGIGKPGNVKADQITLLATRPLGVKAVTNPWRASGGADKENRDQARQNAPLAVMALDRLRLRFSPALRLEVAAQTQERTAGA